MDKTFSFICFYVKGTVEKQHKRGVQHTINASATGSFFGNFWSSATKRVWRCKTSLATLKDDVFILYQILPTRSVLAVYTVCEIKIKHKTRDK